MPRKLLLIMLFTLLATSPLGAGIPAGGDFAITKSTVDNGGGLSAGGSFVLTGTIGQPDANPHVSSGGEFQLAGGFWARVADLSDLIFKDGFE